ncbi:RHS repeat-associated core domain-containing protein [Frankia sp. R82]|uniref:RHS repeat-associated core domain-containing protein n=1 Tax=Frankia sp. R82 TaxID=2950553 RepID=UPI002044BB48|nr:RHS repeat-associated core domain-containing protein [Frankia sp. R82]MCM3886310.1 hypothetical protein [Frankia sp. R82]
MVATVDDNTSVTSPASYAESTEFGSPYFPSSAYPRYGWLGAKQRSRDTLSGLTLMGVRLYDPSLGRFLQTDPVPGGSDNPYDYAHQDPYNTFDLDGNSWWKKVRKAGRWVSNNKWITRCTNWMPGSLGTACAGVQSAGYAVNGQWRAAAGTAAGAAVSWGGGKIIGRSIRRGVNQYDRAVKENVHSWRRRGISPVQRRVYDYSAYLHGAVAGKITSYYAGGGYKTRSPWW